jgi:hypothetical protein
VIIQRRPILIFNLCPYFEEDRRKCWKKITFLIGSACNKSSTWVWNNLSSWIDGWGNQDIAFSWMNFDENFLGQIPSNLRRWLTRNGCKNPSPVLNKIHDAIAQTSWEIWKKRCDQLRRKGLTYDELVDSWLDNLDFEELFFDDLEGNVADQEFEMDLDSLFQQQQS